MPDTAPLSRTLEADLAAVAAGSDGDTIIGESPFAGVVTAATITFEANVTGDNTESRTFTVINKGVDGNGTTVVATLAMTTGVNALDYDEKAMTLSVVADATDVAAGAILALHEVHAGLTGLANPGGKVAVTVTRGQD